MQQKQERHFIVDILFVLALFAVFAISALMLVTIGAGVYRSTVESMSDNYNLRTATAYISEKIRQSDQLIMTAENGIAKESSAVCIGTLETVPALIISAEANHSELISSDSGSIDTGFSDTGNTADVSVVYDTYLYLYDGWLRELTVRRDSYIGSDLLSAGQKIMQLSDLQYQYLESSHLLFVHMTLPDDSTQDICIDIHCSPIN